MFAWANRKLVLSQFADLAVHLERVVDIQPLAISLVIIANKSTVALFLDVDSGLSVE